MKGKIFIAWSGKNELAHAVKQYLEKEDYVGIVGGQSGTDGGLFVGDVVLRELDQCNQAIFIMQEKQDGTISNNLMFELGYALSRFDTNKIHVFYIDITSEDKTIPSDIKGIWASFFNTAESDDIAAEIAEKFFSNQKNIIPEDKMSVVNSYYSIKEKIQRYSESPHCSEYEFAQYILFFSQAAYMFGNEKDASCELKDLIKSLSNPDTALDYAIRFGICYLEVLSRIQKEDGVLCLKKEDFRGLRRRLRDMQVVAESWEKDDFSMWYLTILYDIMNYAHILYASSPELSEEDRIRYLKNGMEYADKCLALCEILESKKQNYLCAQLYKAYMYRNLYTIHSILSEQEAFAYECLEKSIKARKILVDYYEVHTISARLFDNFELEYYLALSEYLEYVTDEDDFYDYKEDCEEYIRRIKDLHRERNFFVDKIETFISKAKL